MSSSLAEPREDNEVEEPEWVGESIGEAVAELAFEENAESVWIVLCKRVLRGSAVEAIV